MPLCSRAYTYCIGLHVVGRLEDQVMQAQAGQG